MTFQLSSLEPVRIVEPHSWIGHIPFAIWLVTVGRPARIVELGVHTGNSFFAFCQAADAEGLATECIGIDTWGGDSHAGYYENAIFAEVSRYAQEHYKHRARLMRMTFDEALNDVEDGSVDLLHIDGLHTYEAVKHDFETWLPKLSSRGIVLFHDIAERRDDFGVYHLWDEVSAQYPHLAFTHSHGLGVLLVGADIESSLKDSLTSHRINPLEPTVADFFAIAGERLISRHSPEASMAAVCGNVRTQLFWRAPDESFSESRSQTIAMPIGAGLQTVEFEFECEALGQLRWDFADRPAAAEILAFTLSGPSGVELWSWDGLVPLFAETGELQEYRTVPGRAMLVSVGIDPRGLLDIPAERLSTASGRISLRVELDLRALAKPVNPIADLTDVEV